MLENKSFLVFGPIPDRNRKYGYSNRDIFENWVSRGIYEFPWYIYGVKSMLKLLVYPFIYMVGLISYSMKIRQESKRYKAIIIAPESPGFFFLGLTLRLVNSNYIELVFVDYYYSPYLTVLDRQRKSIYHLFSIWCAYALDSLMFRYSDVVIQSVSDEASFLDKNYFNFKYSEKIRRVSYPCALVEKKLAISVERITPTNIYFWGSGAPLQGVGDVIDIMNDLVLEGVSCVICIPRKVALGYDINDLVDIRYFDEMSGAEISEFYNEVSRNALLTLGIFGTSMKADHVLPNKIVESFCLGVPVVTRKSDFILEWCYTNGLASSLFYVRNVEEIIDIIGKIKDSNERIVDNVKGYEVFTSQRFHRDLIKLVN